MAKPISVNTMSEYLPKKCRLASAELEPLAAKRPLDRMLPLCDQDLHVSLVYKAGTFEMAQNRLIAC